MGRNLPEITKTWSIINESPELFENTICILFVVVFFSVFLPPKMLHSAGKVFLKFLMYSSSEDLSGNIYYIVNLNY